jgi:hypothetical protein
MFYFTLKSVNAFSLYLGSWRVLMSPKNQKDTNLEQCKVEVIRKIQLIVTK